MIVTNKISWCKTL